MIKLVASDIDGTLILEGQKQLSNELFQIIKELKKHNIVFVAASGRQLASMRRLFSPVADEIYYVSENGALVQFGDEKNVLYEFDRELATRIIREVEKFPDCKLAVSTPSTQYIHPGQDALCDFMVNKVKYHITEVEDFGIIEEPIIKIAFWNPDSYEESYEHFKGIFENEIRVAKAGNMWIDFISFDSNKGTGLKFLLEKLHLSKDEAICFGDQQNDIEMLQYAGTSYAMAHAKEDVKRSATCVTESVEKTLQKLLEDMA